MANINPLKIEYFESFANEITSKFRRLQNIVKHPTSDGDYHEEILRNVLRNFLSKRFSVKKGFIYAGSESNQVSKQIDVMIIDENSPAAYIFQEGDFAIVIPHAVVAVMEIKTTLNSDGFEAALENIRLAKSLMEFPTNITGIVFGFDGKPADETLGNWFKNSVASSFKGREVYAPETIMFFNDSYMLVRCNEEYKIRSDGKHYYPLIGGNDEIKEGMNSIAYQLSLLLAMIINACEQREFNNTHQIVDRQSFNLIQQERSAVVLKRFSFGEGVSEEKVM